MSAYETQPIGRHGHAAVAAESKVKIRDLHKKFGRNRILRGVNLDFQDNAITTILGPSGTGKSVLLKHIVGLLAPDRGEVVVFNENIWKMSEAQRNELRKRFGVLFQDGALFGSMNVYNNVAFPLRKNTDMDEDQIRDVVMRRLEEVGLGAAVNRFPAELSGGMKKRAGFARALATNPEVVMFDEPDSGLDPVRTTLLCKLIREVHAEHKGTYVVVSHDINTVRTVSDYVAVLWHGEIVHNGTKDDAFNSNDPFVKQFLSGGAEGPLGME
jgi:phospholipid/cholesterol/gamma-HCH transport system ATP-binding protein